MRTALPTLVVMCFLASACSTPVRRPAPQGAAPVRAAEAPVAEAASDRQFLRYFDVKDLPLRNGVLIVRGTRAQLSEIDGHLGALRRVLRETEPARIGEKPLAPVSQASQDTVMIHSVADIVERMATVELVGPEGTRKETPQAMLLAVLREKLGEDVWAATTIRFQGEQTLVVKAKPAIHKRIAEILDSLRAQ